MVSIRPSLVGLRVLFEHDESSWIRREAIVTWCRGEFRMKQLVGTPWGQRLLG